MNANARDQHAHRFQLPFKASHAGVYVPANNVRTNLKGFGQPHSQAIRNTNSTIAVRMIREIEIWRGAVLMVNRYADEAEANSFQRAEELRRSRLFGQLPGKNKLKAGSRLLG